MLFKLNKVRCKYCKDVIVSTDEVPEDTCSCGRITIFGGNSFLGRRPNTKDADFEDLSEVDTDFMQTRNINENQGDVSQIKSWQKSQFNIK